MATSVTAQATLLDGETVPAADLRRELPGAVFPSAGIVRGLAASSLPTPDMKVRVPAGLCMVDDGAGGFYPLYLLTQTDLDVAASSATLARIDSVIGEVVDTGVTATLIRRFRVITGTPASSPTAPALPPGDQPTAKTLRVANVFVQVNAETNGKVRAQDVTVVAAKAAVVPRPVTSTQVTNLDDPSPTPVTWTDISSAVWPAVTFVVPASGMVYITVGAETENISSSTATTVVSFRLSGGVTQAANFGRELGGNGIVTGSRRILLTGMTPGVSVTATPAYRMSSLASSRHVRTGNLLVEPV